MVDKTVFKVLIRKQFQFQLPDQQVSEKELPAVWLHPLTFEPIGVDLLDEVGVDVSSYEPGLSDDVPQHRDVVVDTWGRQGSRQIHISSNTHRVAWWPSG